MIPEPGDANREITVTETFHLQTDDELTDKELKQIEADDQAIQTILLGLPKDIYAAVDSCETAQEIWLRVSDQKDNTQNTSANTKFAKQPIEENFPKVGKTNTLSKPVTSNSVSSPQEPIDVNNDKVIAPGMFRINPSKTSRNKKNVLNTVSASARTKPITISQPNVIIKKNVNSDLNGLSSTGLDNTKTRRPQPRSNTKNDRVLSASKSSRSKNQEAKVEEHHRNLLLSKNNEHMSSACNNFKLDSQDVISKFVYAVCKKCLNSVNHDVCLNNYVNGKKSRGRKHKANVSKNETLFDQDGKISYSSESKSQADCSNGDNACTSNTLEPKNKRFPNSTSLLGSQDVMNIVQKESIVDTSDLQTALERTKERFENCIFKKKTEYAKLWNDWYKKCDEFKYDKISYDKAYKDMQQKIERLENAHLKATYKNLFDSISVSRAQNKTIIASLQNELQSTIYKNAKLRTQLFKKVFDQKDNTHDTSANTKFVKQPIMEDLPKIGESHALSKPVTSNSVSTPQEPKVVKNDKVIAPEMFRMNPDKTFREEKNVPNIVRASNRTKPITVSQPPVFIKKDVNSDLNVLSFTGVDNTKTRRPQPRSNIKHDRVPSASKSNRSKNKEAEVEEHHRNLLLSKNNKHISSACNNIKIDSQDVISKVVCDMCYPDLFVVRQLGLFQAHDRKSKASHQFRLEVYGNWQFCDSDLEVAFRRNACFVRNLEGVDLLKGGRSTNLYTINLHEMDSVSPICHMARASSTKS
nr:integrase, catalytic region, zinc finger, CCHC-type, peptidase aspartic, catalytic [Tanacetum cinerariifolium]